MLPTGRDEADDVEILAVLDAASAALIAGHAGDRADRGLAVTMTLRDETQPGVE